MTPIKNINVYIREMKKSSADKMFFLDYLNDIDNLVDFGCADGIVLHNVAESNTNIKLFGIDMNDDMINLAKELVPTAKFNVGKSAKFDDTLDYSMSAINLSSVLHEVYSYSTDEEINEFWNNIKNSRYKYIFIRDMISNLSDELSKNDDIEKIRSKNEYKQHLNDFESIWGSISKQRNLVHFLLKYRYNENWSREVKENYIPLTGDKLIAILSDKYETIYRSEYTLPFLHERIMEDFNIDLKDDTHIKLVLKLRDRY